MKLTEQMILMQALNSAAAENGRKLSKKGSFTNLYRTQDNTLYWAECVGSGKNPYRTSIDFSTSETAPTCRCYSDMSHLYAHGPDMIHDNEISL